MEMQEQFEVLVDDDGEFTVERFPKDFVERLASVTADQRSSLLTKWAQSEENQHLPPAAITEMFDEMVALSKKAKAQNKQVYICNEC
jgi:hypothetical protein